MDDIRGCRPMAGSLAFAGSARSMVCMAVALLCVAQVEAAEWYITPSLSQSVEYNDNRRLSLTDEDKAYAIRTTIGARLGVRTPRSMLELDPDFQWSRYKGGTSRDTEDPSVGLRGEHQYSERVSFDFDGSYSEQSTLIAEIEDSGVLDTDGTRINWSISPSASLVLTQQASLTATASLAAIEYSDITSTTLVDSETKSITLSGSYVLSPRSSMTVLLFGNRFEVPSSLRINRSWGGQVGYSHSFSETFSFNVAIGPRKNRIKVGSVESSSNSLNVNLGVDKSFENTQVGLTLSRSETSSGIGERQERDNISFYANRKFSERLSGNFIASFDKSDTRDIFRVGPMLTWRIAENLRLAGGFKYASIDRATETGNARSNAVFLRVSYTGRKHSVSR